MLNRYDPNVVVPQVGDILVRKPEVSESLIRTEMVQITTIEENANMSRRLLHVMDCSGKYDYIFGMWLESALEYYDFYHCADPKESERPTAKEDENPKPQALSFIEWLYQDQLAAARGRPSQATVTPPKPAYHKIANGRVELADPLDRECAERKDEAQVLVDAAQGGDCTAYHVIRADGIYAKRQWGKVEELRYKGAAIQNALIDWNR